jgi:NAD(P)-dependent dehydrogenase (short-subunit alcohol dehydrogenase family)
MTTGPAVFSFRSRLFGRRLPSIPPGHAVVTGAASGFGRALASRLRAEGWRLALVDLEGPSWPPQPPCEGVVAVAFDVRDAVAWRTLHDRLREAWPRLDLLVNAAGVGAAGEVGTLPAEQWRRVLDTNLLGTALGCETFVPWLRQHPHRSHLINVASVAAVTGLPALAAYSASKAGVVALSETIAAECPRGRPGVTVACPGFFRSGLLDRWYFSSATAAVEAARRMASTRRTADGVARRVWIAARRGRRYCVIGVRSRWLWRLTRLAPRAATWLAASVYRIAKRQVAGRSH